MIQSEAMVAQSLIGFAGLLILALVVGSLLTPRKSRQYRKVIMDMYVSAKIKQLAKEDSIDIVEEFESFKKWAKKERLTDSELDDTVEEEIKERVAEPTKKSK